MPLNSSSGGRPGGPDVLATSSDWRPTTTARTSIASSRGAPLMIADSARPARPAASLLEHIGARSRAEGLVSRIAQRTGSGHFGVRARVQPVTPVQPPAAFVLL